MKTPVLAVRGFPVRGASLVSLLAAVAGLLFSACSPTLDWREVRPEGGYLTVLLPCKPERLSRDLVLGEGPPRRIELLACTAGGGLQLVSGQAAPVRNCIFASGWWIGLESVDAYNWLVDNCQLEDLADRARLNDQSLANVGLTELEIRKFREFSQIMHPQRTVTL